ADARALLGELGDIFGGFLRGQLLLCLLMGIFTLLSLYLLDLFHLHFEYTLLVSLLCAVLYAVPYVGIFVATVVACLLAYLQTGHYLLPLLLFLIISVLSRVVDNVFVPIVMGKEVGVSPLFIIFAIFAGGELAGFWGLILAIPVAAMLRAICVFIWKRYSDLSNDKQPVGAS
ncbi:MAG: AI-2E family transporter, partial [Armatimonadetes bacterium]|nr:AI-2E family transporter [Armatimonadota bacterium]